MSITITEALAELKTLNARVGKKREFVRSHLTRPDNMVDPLEKDGGSINVLKKEMQSISDLEERMVLLRCSINRANSSTSVTIGEQTRTVEAWLIWRREVRAHRVAFLNGLSSHLSSDRSDRMGYGRSKEETGSITNLSEGTLAKNIESLAEVDGTLDGKLSLINATTAIEM